MALCRRRAAWLCVGDPPRAPRHAAAGGTATAKALKSRSWHSFDERNIRVSSGGCVTARHHRAVEALTRTCGVRIRDAWKTNRPAVSMAPCQRVLPHRGGLQAGLRRRGVQTLNHQHQVRCRRETAGRPFPRRQGRLRHRRGPRVSRSSDRWVSRRRIYTPQDPREPVDAVLEFVAGVVVRIRIHGQSPINGQCRGAETAGGTPHLSDQVGCP